MMSAEAIPREEYNAYEKTVLDSLREAGLESEPDPEIVQRLAALEAHSPFNEDSRKIRMAVEKIMEHLSIKESGDVTIAAIIHDIGKAGPAHASKEEEMAVINLYAAENLRDPKQSVEDAVKEISPEDAGAMIANLRSCGVEPSETMRAFWDRHGTWTHDVLEQWPKNFSRNVRVIAATHHIDRGINPYNLAESDVPMQAKMVGTMEYYVEALQMRALMVADKMEAAMRRSGNNHEEAMAVTKRILGSMAHDDEAMGVILRAVDERGKAGNLFGAKVFRAAA